MDYNSSIISEGGCGCDQKACLGVSLASGLQPRCGLSPNHVLRLFKSALSSVQQLQLAYFAHLTKVGFCNWIPTKTLVFLLISSADSLSLVPLILRGSSPRSWQWAMSGIVAARTTRCGTAATSTLMVSESIVQPTNPARRWPCATLQK